MADRLALHQGGQIVHVADPDTFMKIDDPIINFLRENISHKPRKEIH
jgi:hypothetical protein